MSSSINFNTFPKEMIEQTFFFVDVPQLGKCALVCKKWNQILKEWQLLKILSNLQIKESPDGFINRRRIDSLDLVFNKLNEFFVKELQPGQQGLFKCVFLLNPDCKISVICGRNIKKIIPENSAVKICFFEKKIFILDKSEMKTICGDNINLGFDHFFQWEITFLSDSNTDEMSCDLIDKKILTCFNESCFDLREKEPIQVEKKKPLSLKKVVDYFSRKK